MTTKKDIEYSVLVYSEYKIISKEPLTKGDIMDRLATQLAEGNILAENEFWENANVVCRKCGISIQHLDEEADGTIYNGYCAQCDAEVHKNENN